VATGHPAAVPAAVGAGPALTGPSGSVISPNFPIIIP